MPSKMEVQLSLSQGHFLHWKTMYGLQTVFIYRHVQTGVFNIRKDNNPETCFYSLFITKLVSIINNTTF